MFAKNMSSKMETEINTSRGSVKGMGLPESNQRKQESKGTCGKRGGGQQTDGG